MGFIKAGTRTSDLAKKETKKSKGESAKKRKLQIDNLASAISTSHGNGGGQRQATGYELYDKPWPPLERLPAEIIQEIFILSVNPNLALASQRLSRVLSHSSSYLKLEMLSAVLVRVMELACENEKAEDDKSSGGGSDKREPTKPAASDLLRDHFARRYVNPELFRVAEVRALSQSPWPSSGAMVDERLHATVDADRNMLMLPDFELPSRLFMPPYEEANMRLLLSVYERMDYTPSKTRSGTLERALMAAIRNRHTVMMAFVLHNVGVKVTKFHMAEAFTRSVEASWEHDEAVCKTYERRVMDEEQLLAAELNLTSGPLSKLFRKRGSEPCVAIRIVNMVNSWLWRRTRQQLEYDDPEIWSNALSTGGPIRDWLLHHGNMPNVCNYDIFRKVVGEHMYGL